MSIYQLERLILWEDITGRFESDISNKMRKIVNSKFTFNWRLKRNETEPSVNRLVFVDTSEQLSEEISISERLGLQPYIVFPHNSKSWLNELGDHFISAKIIYWDEQPNTANMLLSHPSTQVLDSWKSVFLNSGVRSNIDVSRISHAAITAISDEFSRWLKLTEEWKVQEQLEVCFKDTDFIQQSDGWFVHKLSPFIRYREESKFLNCFGCMPSHVEQKSSNQPGPVGNAMETFLSWLFAGATASGSAEQTTAFYCKDRDGFIIEGKYILEGKHRPVNKFIMKSGERYDPKVITSIYTVSCPEKAQEAKLRLIECLEFLWDKAEKQNGWLYLDVTVGTATTYFFLVDMNELPLVDDVKAYDDAVSFSFYGTDNFGELLEQLFKKNLDNLRPSFLEAD